MYYTYIHLTLDTGEVFYVGKGKASRNRAYRRENRSLYWHNVVNKHGFKVQIIREFSLESEAFADEVRLIEHYRKLGARLVNLTNGGDGISGWVHSQEFRLWQSKRMLEEAKKPAMREKRSVAQKKRFSEAEARIAHGKIVANAWTDEKKQMARDRFYETVAAGRHPRLKITYDIGLEMIALRVSGERVKDIAKRFSMHRTSVGAYLRSQLATPANRIRSKAPEVLDVADAMGAL